MQALEGIRSEVLNKIFEFVTMFGEETLLIVFIAVFYFVIDKKLARRIFFITASSLGVNGIVKNFAKVPRPFASGEVTCVRPDTATGYSFPSGHTQCATTWTNAFAVHLKKWWMTVIAVVLTLAVGFSRMYLGAHYPSDVIVGTVIGLLFAVFGNIAYDRIENKNILHAIVVLAYTPFIFVFLFNSPNKLYADFYKLYGMLVGYLFAVMLDDKYVDMKCDGPIWKRFIRVIISIVAVLAVKEGLKLVFVFSSVELMLIFSAVRYFFVMFVMLGLCPLLFKKIKI
ncbi:MAG: phosphatase PAP2 family protein [Clostridia bacterium]|nr:phosphatase PAP2 family protein [Clostridia bacterium]